MEAALVEGLTFVQDDRGYWEPRQKADHTTTLLAQAILLDVATALHFPSVERYLRRCGSHPADVKARIAALHTAPAPTPEGEAP